MNQPKGRGVPNTQQNPRPMNAAAPIKKRPLAQPQAGKRPEYQTLKHMYETVHGEYRKAHEQNDEDHMLDDVIQMRDLARTVIDQCQKFPQAFLGAPPGSQKAQHAIDSWTKIRDLWAETFKTLHPAGDLGVHRHFSSPDHGSHNPDPMQRPGAKQRENGKGMENGNEENEEEGDASW